MPGDPHSGSKVWKAPDREIGKPGENRRKVIADRDLEPTAAFHNRESRCNLPSCQWGADVDPVFSTQCHRTHGILRQVSTRVNGCNGLLTPTIRQMLVRLGTVPVS
jgi:hypothetical protein